MSVSVSCTLLHISRIINELGPKKCLVDCYSLTQALFYCQLQAQFSLKYPVLYFLNV